MAEPGTNLSPGSTSGMSAARADENGTRSARCDRRQVGERVGQRGEERRVGSAVDQDGDGHLSELVTGEGEYLGTPQRTELADGEDLAVGRPGLGCPPVAARMDGLGSLAFVPAFVTGAGMQLPPRRPVTPVEIVARSNLCVIF